MPAGQGCVHERADTNETERVRQPRRILSRLLSANERDHKAVLPVLQLLAAHRHDVGANGDGRTMSGVGDGRVSVLCRRQSRSHRLLSTCTHRHRHRSRQQMFGTVQSHTRSRHHTGQFTLPLYESGEKVRAMLSELRADGNQGRPTRIINTVCVCKSTIRFISES